MHRIQEKHCFPFPARQPCWLRAFPQDSVPLSHILVLIPDWPRQEDLIVGKNFLVIPLSFAIPSDVLLVI